MRSSLLLFDAGWEPILLHKISFGAQVLKPTFGNSFLHRRSYVYKDSAPELSDQTVRHPSHEAQSNTKFRSSSNGGHVAHLLSMMFITCVATQPKCSDRR